MFLRIALLLVFAFAVTHCHRAEPLPEIPSFLRVCHRNDPHLDECIKSSVATLRPYLRKGIPELNIPPCEPLSVPEVELSQMSGPVSIRSTYKSIKVWGATDFVLRSIKLDTEKNRVKLKLYIPRLEVESYYNMEGKILMLPIRGHGPAFGNYTDIDVVATVQAERYYNSHTKRLHLRVTEFFCDFEVGRAKVHLDNLFNGDATLSNAMNRFLNDNWKIVAAEMKPALEDTIARLFKSFFNKIYAKYPVDALLPP